MQSLHVTYLLSSYPGLTTTFVDREIIAMREMGVQLHVLALRQPETMISGDQTDLHKTVTYLYPARPAGVWLSHLRLALIHPWRYFSTLFYLLTRRHPPFFDRRKTLRQFSMGVYASNLLRNRPLDHLHVHIINWAIVALVVSRLLKVPYSVTAHASGDIFVKPVLLNEKLGNAKFVATCTRYNADFLKEYGKNVFDDKVKCIYHGLDVQRYRREHPLPPTACPVIIGVGQLKERKGFHVLVDALGTLKDQGLDFECRIIGEGPMRAELEEQIRRLGLSNHVHLYGALPHEEVFAQYEQSHIFALPAVMAGDGDRDGIPNVILEAMAMELPVVSTWHSGIPEVIEDGVNGLLVPPQDRAALAEALSRLLQNPALREQMGRSGRQTVVENFDPRKNARMLFDEISA